MAEYYGTRKVDMKTPDELVQRAAMMGMSLPEEMPTEFDFGQLKDHPMTLKLDIGASSYYSEIASLNTLDNLLQNNRITAVQYLERVPDGHIPGRRKLIEELKQMEAQQAAMAQQQAQPQGGGIIDQNQRPELPQGGGYSALQRKVNEAGTTAGLI